jgi:predicted nucleotidyltransferase component of viral defense system
MKLHENKDLFNDAVLAASQHFNIPEIYIEKDYWVTMALYAIFHSPIAEEAVFKGGTALAKCNKLIERFSEDIDIVVLQREGETDAQLKKKIRAISKVVEKVMPEIEIAGLTNKLGQIRKTVHEYNKGNFKGEFGQVREHIILEATWLGNSEPFTIEDVGNYIAEMMKVKGQDSLIEEYNLKPFKVKVLSKERTLCEKIMSLVRFSQTDDAITDLANKIRHIYDLHQMLKNEEIKTFFASSAFDEMLIKVGKDDVKSFRNNNEWLANHPSKALIFMEPDDTWDKIKTTYRTNFKNLVIGKLPDENDLILTLKSIGERLETVKWKL